MNEKKYEAVEIVLALVKLAVASFSLGVTIGLNVKKRSKNAE